MPRPSGPRSGPAHERRLLLPARIVPHPRRHERQRRPDRPAAQRPMAPEPPASRQLRGPRRRDQMPQAARGRPPDRARPRRDQMPPAARDRPPDRARPRRGQRRHARALEHRAHRARPVRQHQSRARRRAEPGPRHRSRVRRVQPGRPVRGRARRVGQPRSPARDGQCPRHGPGRPSQRQPSSARQGQRPEADELATGTTKDAPAGNSGGRIGTRATSTPGTREAATCRR